MLGALLLQIVWDINFPKLRWLKKIGFKEWPLELNGRVGRGKLVPVLNELSIIPWSHMEEWRYSSTILDLSTRCCWVVSFMLWLLYSEETAASTHCIGVWLSPRAGLDAVQYWNISCPCWDGNPGCPARSLLLFVCVCKGWARIPALAPLPSMIYCELTLYPTLWMKCRTLFMGAS
jgi:hypothetical protein